MKWLAYAIAAVVAAWVVVGLLMQQAFVELFANAIQHERAKDVITVTAECAGGDFLFLRLDCRDQTFPDLRRAL